MQNILSRQVSVDNSVNLEKVVDRYKNLFQEKTIVSLSANQFPKISSYFKLVENLCALSEINLTNCGLQQFNLESSILSKTLLKLNLSYNPLKTIPSAILRFTNLRELRLVGCGLANVFPFDLLQLEELILLDVSYNFCNSLPDHTVHLRRIHYLYLSAVSSFTARDLPITIENFMDFCQKYYLPSFENLSIEKFSEKVNPV